MPALCFDYQEKPLLASVSTGTDFSDDVFVSATGVPDNNEVIEHLSNLAYEKSGGGGLINLNPKVCNYAQRLEQSVRCAQYQIGVF